jgi:uncharacterized protein YciI
MAFFTVICADKPGILELRLERRPEHVAYLKTVESMIRVAGPLLDTEGKMCGSLFVVEADDVAGAQAFSANDPFTKVGVFGRVEINAFTKTMGSWT